jgi:hypothetical protein
MQIGRTTSGIEPVTYWTLAQWCKQLRHRVPKILEQYALN